MKKKREIDSGILLAIKNKISTPELLHFCLKNKVISKEEKYFLEIARNRSYFGAEQYERFADFYIKRSLRRSCKK